jgi:cytidylate kinase
MQYSAKINAMDCEDFKNKVENYLKTGTLDRASTLIKDKKNMKNAESKAPALLQITFQKFPQHYAKIYLALEAATVDVESIKVVNGKSEITALAALSLTAPEKTR